MGTQNRRRCSPRCILIQSVIVCSLLTIRPVHAELDYGLSLGAGETNNIGRTDGGERSETIGVVGVDLTWQEQTRRIDADVAVDLSYYEYLDDTYDGELLGTANGSVVLGIVPDRFTWLVQDTFGQVQADPFQPSTPDTRENINYFTTGPNFTLRFGSAGFARLFGRYSTVNYEESLLDTERVGAGLALGRELSQRSEVALNAVSESVEFEDLLNQDFDLHHVFLSYQIEGSRTELSTELGYTWLEHDAGEETGGALVNVAVSRDMSPSSTVRLEVGTQFTDASASLRTSAGQVGGGGSADVTATADPFENRFASVQWSFVRNRTSFSLGAAWNEDTYEEQTLFDRTRLVYEAGLHRQVTQTVGFGFRGTLSDEEFENTDLAADELTLAAELTWRLGRRVGLTLTVEHFERDTSTGVGEFDEDRAFLMLSYRPRGGTRPAVP